jgi:hypothetical protein
VSCGIGELAVIVSGLLRLSRRLGFEIRISNLAASAWFGLGLKSSNEENTLGFHGCECPIQTDTSTPSCGKSRFGCWTCTVVERDKASEGLLVAGNNVLCLS